MSVLEDLTVSDIESTTGFFKKLRSSSLFPLITGVSIGTYCSNSGFHVLKTEWILKSSKRETGLILSETPETTPIADLPFVPLVPILVPPVIKVIILAIYGLKELVKGATISAIL